MAGLRDLLEQRVGRIWVAGEISDYYQARSGHCYFNLVDASAQARVVLFRGDASRLPFELEDGLEVVLYGDVTVYEPRGALQITARVLEPRGRGALQLAFEQLRRRLDAEGLFDADRKKEIPVHPERIGVVTSTAGAAIRDFLQVTGRRFPSIPILVAPTRVQGEGAEVEISAAIERLSERSDISVIVVTRGGGSLEDLMAFNSELVARAISRCPIPVVAGVGHEVDLTIADLVADLRAPTPSAAAEMVVPDRMAHRSRLTGQATRLRVAMENLLERGAHRAGRLGDSLRALDPSLRLSAQRSRMKAAIRGLALGMKHRVERMKSGLEPTGRALMRASRMGPMRSRERLELASHGLVRVIPGMRERERARLARLAGRLDSLSPLGVLDRGYALVRREDDGAIVRRADEVGAGDRLEIRVAAAEITSVVENVRVPEDGA